MEYPDVLQYRLLKEANSNPNYINKRLNNMERNNILNNGCLSPFSVKELNKYLYSYYPQQICEFTVTPDAGENISCYNALFRRSGGSKSYDYSYIDCEIYEYVKIFDNDFNDRIGRALFDETQFKNDFRSSYADENNRVPLPDGTYSIGYDLVTTYYLLKNRLSCGNQGFAKKVVLDSLDYIYQNANAETLFLYLLCNGFMMGINIPSRYNYILGKNYEDIEGIISSAEILYPKIKRYLENIDDEEYQVHSKYILDDSKKYIEAYKDFLTTHMLKEFDSDDY